MAAEGLSGRASRALKPPPLSDDASPNPTCSPRSAVAAWWAASPSCASPTAWSENRQHEIRIKCLSPSQRSLHGQNSFRQDLDSDVAPPATYFSSAEVWESIGGLSRIVTAKFPRRWQDYNLVRILAILIGIVGIAIWFRTVNFLYVSVDSELRLSREISEFMEPIVLPDLAITKCEQACTFLNSSVIHVCLPASLPLSSSHGTNALSTSLPPALLPSLPSSLPTYLHVPTSLSTRTHYPLPLPSTCRPSCRARSRPRGARLGGGAAELHHPRWQLGG